MNKTIWKFKLATEIEMPQGAKVLSVHTQNGESCLWVLLDPDPDMPKETRRFLIFGTGHPINRRELGFFIGTILVERDTLVFHVFEHCSN